MAMSPVVVRGTLFGNPVGLGVQGARWVQLEGVGKEDPDGSSRVVANEFICNRLALMLALPTPAGSLVRFPERSGPIFVSLRFSDPGAPIVGINPKSFAAKFPELAAGIVAFDVWVANHDRHADNIAWVDGQQPPVIYDHGLALGGSGRPVNLPPAGRGLLVNRAVPCLRPHIDSPTHLIRWAEEISHLALRGPDRVCEEAALAGLLTRSEARQISDFLKERSMLMRQSLLPALFPGLVPHDDWSVL